MTEQDKLRSLGRLVELRGRELDRLTADMAGKQAMRARYRSNIERIEHLARDSGASGSLPLAQSVNCADYKQAMLQIVNAHRQDLGLHEADMAVAQQVLIVAARRKEVLGQVLEQRHQDAARAQTVQQQKRDDELASQMWWRGRT
jgi:flagellar export protein FliJ